jgi:hypothetical protein
MAGLFIAVAGIPQTDNEIVTLAHWHSPEEKKKSGKKANPSFRI